MSMRSGRRAPASYPYRAGYRPRTPYRRPVRASQGRAAGLLVLAVLSYAAGAKLAAPHDRKPAAPAPKAQHPVQLTTVTGSGETAFMTAVLRDLGAPVTDANIDSLARWAAKEGPYGTVAASNPLDTTLYEPGATVFNTFTSRGTVLHVWNYPTATEGAHATALTIEGGYPQITAALRSGAGLDKPGLAAEFRKWSGNGYEGVS